MQSTPLSSKKFLPDENSTAAEENSTALETDKTKEVEISPNHSPEDQHSPEIQRLAAEVTEAAMKIIYANPELQAYLLGGEPKQM